MQGTSVSAGIQIQIGGGYYNNVSAARLMRESAELSTEAVKAGIREQMEDLYATLDATTTQLELLFGKLKGYTGCPPDLHPSNDLQSNTLAQRIGNVDGFSLQLETLLSTYILTRVQILGLMGTLLEQIEKLPAASPAKAG